MKQTIVLYALPTAGHLISVVELGKQIINHNPSFSVTILISAVNSSSKSQTSPHINHISERNPSIIFHHLPPPSQQQQPETSVFEIIRLNNPFIHQTLQTISLTSTISAFILDLFCAPALEITTQLRIPSYFFFTAGSNSLALLLYLQTLHKFPPTEGNNFIEVPGLPPMLANDMPSETIDRASEAYQAFLLMSHIAVKAKGIIVNTFESLEFRAIKAVKDGLCVSDSPTPPIYCIGPLIAEPMASDEDRSVECLTWLDSHPSRSVVFLCFGSEGVFSAAQLKEIAIGLERTGLRFLWVVRNALTEDKGERSLASTEFDLDDLLPKGFLDRTKERGLVVKSWAPQVDVLNRESVGGFVTHCGWNSVLESICTGVPIIGWPLYAEQRLNRVILVQEMKLALHLNESENGFVTASEIEERVRMLMDSEEGRQLRERVLVARDESKSALSEGGSSHSALAELVESWGRG